MFVTVGNAFAGEEKDAGPDCAGAGRCDDACNSPPDTQPAVRYPVAATPVDVLCPTVILEGAHDPESRVNGLYYRVVIDVADENPPAEPYFYDSGLITAVQPTSSQQIIPSVETLTPGQAYWMRVWVNDDCSDPPNDIFVQGPPTQVYFEVARDAQNNCPDGLEVPDGGVPGQGDGGPSGGGSAGCCSTAGQGPDAGSLAVVPLAVLAFAATRRRR